MFTRRETLIVNFLDGLEMFTEMFSERETERLLKLPGLESSGRTGHSLLTSQQPASYGQQQRGLQQEYKDNKRPLLDNNHSNSGLINLKKKITIK